MGETKKKGFLPVVLVNACDLTIAGLSSFLQEMTPAKKTKFQLFPAFLAVYKKVPLIKEIRPAESKQMFFPGLQC